MVRLLSALAFAIATGAYLALFALDHVESFQTSPWIYWMIWTPFVMVVAAARLWPRWWLVPAFAFHFVIPFAVEQLEVEMGLYVRGGGMDNIGSSILAFFAFPAAALAGFAVFVVRRLA
jgi:hypothetical protein